MSAAALARLRLARHSASCSGIPARLRDDRERAHLAAAAAGLAIVWLAPNSQALARYTVDRVAAIRLPSPALAFAAGAMLAAAIMGLDRVSTFLYYQF